MNWALFALAVLATLGALVAVLTWWTQLRRTPEVEFTWRRGDQLTEWKVREKVTIPKSGGQLVHLALTNVGIGSARLLVINIVVPAWIDLVSHDKKASLEMTAVEPAVGHSEPEAHFVAIKTENFLSAMDLMTSFTLSARLGAPEMLQDGIVATDFFVAVSVEAEGLTPNGRRVIPSFAHKTGKARVDFWHNTDEWPGQKYWPWYRGLRQVRTMPEANVRCGPGKRMDRREITAE